MIIPDHITVENVDEYIKSQLLIMLTDPRMLKHPRIGIYPNSQTRKYVVKKYELWNSEVGLKFPFTLNGLAKEYDDMLIKAWDIPIPDTGPVHLPLPCPTKVRYDYYGDNNVCVTMLDGANKYDIVFAVFDEDYFIFYLNPWKIVTIKRNKPIKKLRRFWDAGKKEYRLDIRTLLKTFPKYNKTIMDWLKV